VDLRTIHGQQLQRVFIVSDSGESSCQVGEGIAGGRIVDQQLVFGDTVCLDIPELAEEKSSDDTKPPA
jgi:hypothetical protein